MSDTLRSADSRNIESQICSRNRTNGSFRSRKRRRQHQPSLDCGKAGALSVAPAHGRPSACRRAQLLRGNLSRDFTTRLRSPEVSSTAFSAQPPDLQPASLMDMGFVVICQLARRRMPPIRFLFIGSHLCSTLPSDPASRRRPALR